MGISMVSLATCFYLASVLCLSSGQVTTKGTCAAFDSKQKFSNSMFYSGSWYVIEGYPNRYHGNISCEEFFLSTDQKYVYINDTVYNSSSQRTVTSSGKARLTFSKGVNCLVLNPGIKSFPVGSYMWIVSTDYSNYAVLYVCHQAEELLAREYVYILSRSSDLPRGFRARLIVSHIVREGLPVAPLRPMDQENCPHE